MHIKMLLVILGLVGLVALPASGQERAITESGDTVILKPDGTWLALENYNPASSCTNSNNLDTAVRN